MNKAVALRDLTPAAVMRPKVETLQKLGDQARDAFRRLSLANNKIERANGDHAVIAAEDNYLALVQHMTDHGAFDQMRRCDQIAGQVCPADYWDADGRVSRAHVSILLGEFLGSFVVDNVREPKVFSRVLLEDVLAQEPHYIDLESACRRLRRTCKFIPSISEVLTALEEESKAWVDRFEAWDCVEYWTDQRPKEIAAARAQREAEQAGKAARAGAEGEF